MAGTLSCTLRRQHLITSPGGFTLWEITETPTQLQGNQTALLLCDVWDHHWCRGAERRLEPMLPRMNAVVKACRDKGVLIVHAPSNTMSFYEDHPARLRVKEAPTIDPPPALEHEDPPSPIDASDGGGDTPGDEAKPMWTSQHPAIHIDPERDVISDSGTELYSVYRQRRIEQVLIMGVHTNMCVLHRSFAIKQLVKWGMKVALIRDLTDTMYNPARPPYVSHEEGTRLVVEFIEKFWCPTLRSDDLV
jgi:nicotinamidase-related amidase